MFNGAGKYDDLCTIARLGAGARGAALIILQGNEGTGFSVQAPLAYQITMPQMLRALADNIEAAIKEAAFTCPNCKRVSYLPEDRANGYCGACHDYTAAQS